MKQQQKSLYAGFVILLVAALAIWYFSTKKTSSPTDSSSNTGKSQQNGNTIPTRTSPTEAKVWTGTLKTSDDSKKGNLMLVTSERNIYLKTSRDYSALVGKEVKVDYSGDLNGFTLLGISAK